MRLSAGLALLAVLVASPEMRYFRYEHPIQTNGQQSGQSCVVLDPGIFSHAADGLADLRLYRDGAETPYVLRTAEGAAGGEKQIAPLNLGRRDGETVFDANLPDGPYSDLQLDVKGQNFIATVTVTGSRTEAGSAATRIGAYTIFDLTRQKLGRSTVLHLPNSDFRFLHFRIRGPLAPESITGVSVKRLPATPPGYQVVAQSYHSEEKGRASIYEFTVPAHLPVERIAFTPTASPAQFSREVNISVAPVPTAAASEQDQLQPTAFFSGELLRVHRVENGQHLDEERLSIDTPWAASSTPTRWTITIENGDDAPLPLERVRLEMLERSLCFDGAANAHYTLYYGDPALRAPRYDYAELFTPQANPQKLATGPEELNPAYRPRPDDRPFTERHPALLWVALILVIALLGVIAVRSARQTAPPE